MAITMDALVASLSAKPKLDFSKQGIATEGVGTWSSLWKCVGVPAAGATAQTISASVNTHICTRSTTGAVTGWTNAAGGNANYLAQVDAMATAVGTLILVDRLWAVSGFVTNTGTGAVSVTNPSDIPARDDNGAALGVGVEPWFEIYTAPGATGATWTLTGTDEAGTTTRTWTYTHPANAETIGQMMPAYPGGGSAGLMGMRRLVSFTTSALTGTAGDIGITLIRRLATLQLPLANVGQLSDFAATAMERIYDDSCIQLMWLNGAATPMPPIMGGLKIAELTP
jgi:hypothetical protein